MFVDKWKYVSFLFSCSNHDFWLELFTFILKKWYKIYRVHVGVDKSRKPPSTDEGKKPDYAKILSRSSVRRNDNGNPRWANPYFHFFRDHIRFLCFEMGKKHCYGEFKICGQSNGERVSYKSYFLSSRFETFPPYFNRGCHGFS